MKTADLAKLTLEELKKRIDFCEKQKQKLINYLQSLKDKFLAKELTYQDYEKIVNAPYESKNVSEWFEYYDTYIKDCKERIKSQETRILSSRIFSAFLWSAVFISVFLALFYASPTLIGLVVQEPSSFYQNISQEFTTSQDYTLNLENPGKLYSLKLSGKIEGNGSVKIYLDELLVLDSNKLQPKVLEETPAEEKSIPLTGFAIEGEEKSPSMSIPETPSETPAPETPQEQEQPSQEEPVSETPAETSTSEETQAPEEQPSGTSGIEEETTEQVIKEFSFLCEETCELGEQGLQGNSFTLKIEIENAKLFLESMKYEIKEIEIPENITEELNITIPEANLTNLTIQNITQVNISSISLMQYPAVINKPVKWVKKIELKNATKSLAVELPETAENIKFYKIINENKMELSEDKIITSEEIENDKEGKLAKFSSFAKKEKNVKKLIIEEEIQQAEIEYYTEAPQAFEENLSNGKIIIVSGPDNLNYTNILAYTGIPETLAVGKENRIKIFWRENASFVDFTAKDTNNNSKLDYVEWNVAHLSNQTFEILIEISRAEHLDENRTFIEDIYNETYARDNVWKEIPAGDYVRVTFQEGLNNKKVIRIYARSSSNGKVEVYALNGTEKISESEVISEEKEYKILLLSLSDVQDTFDLKVVNGSVEFDYIVDPTTRAVIKNVQHGSTSIAVGSTNTTVTISSANKSSSFLMFNYNINDASPSNILVMGNLSSATTLYFERVGTATAVNIEWYVAEFSSGVNVQRGQNAFATATVNIPLASVNTSSSFPLVSWRNSGSTLANDDIARIRITNSTNVQLNAYSATTDNTAWQVMSYAGMKVQNGTLNFTSLATATANINPVNLSKAFIIATWDYNSGTLVTPNIMGILANFTNSTQVYFGRQTSSVTATNIDWYVVEFTGNERVQTGNAAFSTTDTSINVPITSVDLTKSIAFLSGNQKGGRGNYSTDDNFGPVWFSANLTNSTNLNLQRGVASGSTANAQWFVVEFSGDTSPAVNLDSPIAGYVNSTSQYVNLTFNASVSDDYSLVNCSLWHNATGTWHLNQTQTKTGTSNITSFSLNSLTNKTFIWNIKCFDDYGQSSFASANRTVILNWSTIVDNEYPIFSNYWDNNASLVGSGMGLFNVTIQNTNGTVILEINNTNITATNLTANVYNASYNFTSNGTYAYKWHSWGNGTSHNYNVSATRSYTVNASIADNLPNVTLSYPQDNYANSTSKYVDLIFNATVTDNSNITNCSLWHNYTGTWHLNQTQTRTGTSNVTNFTLNDLTNKTFIWNIKCFDDYGQSSFATSNRTVILNWTPTDANFTFLSNETTTTPYGYLNGSLINVYFENLINAMRLDKWVYNGSYTSQAFGSGIVYNWINISWVNSTYTSSNGTQQNLETGSSKDDNLTDIYLIYHLNENPASNSTTTLDYSGNNRTGTLVINDGQTNITGSGMFNQAMYFNGTSGETGGNYISTGLYDNLPRWTVSVWVKADALPGSAGSATGPVMRERNYQIVWDHTSAVERGTVSFRSSSVAWKRASFNITSNDTGRWVHLLGTYNNQTLKAYKDGVLIESVNAPGPIDAEPDHPLYIARHKQPGQTNIEFFDGLIDEVAIWNRSFDEWEIKNLYERGATNLNLSVRSCDDTNCAGESFEDVPDNSPQQLYVGYNHYFQYKFDFGTDNLDYSPAIYNVTVKYTIFDGLVVNLVSPTPANNSFLNTTSVIINATIIPKSVAQNCTLEINGQNESMSEYVSETNKICTKEKTLSQDQHNITVYANDTQGIFYASQKRYITIDSIIPSVIVLAPLQGSQFNVTNTIEISANVTDSGTLDKVLANITYPNGLSEILTLNNAGNNKYNSSFTIGLSIGQFNITFLANDTAGNINNTEKIYFISNSYPPSILNIKLNATSPNNFTSDNLTCNYQLNASATTSAVSWLKNNQRFLILLMQFEGNSSNALLDFSGGGHNGTSYSTESGPTWNKTGGFDRNGSFYFNGLNSERISLTNFSQEIANSSITLLAWVKSSSTPGEQYFASFNSYNGSSRRLTLGHNNNGNTLISSGCGTYDSGIVAFDGNWHQVGYILNDTGNNLTLIVDGSIAGSYSCTSSILPSDLFTLGAEYDGAYSHDYTGWLDNVRIYNTTLSIEQIRAIYQNKTNTIVSQELKAGENWTCKVTPFSFAEAGQTYVSNNLTISQIIDTPPVVTLSYPPNNYANSTSQYVNLTFNASVTDDIQLANCSLWHNYTGTWHLNQTQTRTGTSNTTNFTLNSLTNKTFIWNIKCFDNSSQSAFASSNRTVILSWAANQAPQVTYVSPIPNVNPSEANYTTITFNLTIYDANGFSDINASSINTNFTKSGIARQSSSCLNLANYSSNYANYSCSVNMWYFDSAGNWNISVSGKDIAGLSAVNDSTYFQYNQLTAMVISPTALTWPALSPNAFNQTSNNDPTTINNTGNANLTIQINSTNLYGETDNSKAIYAGNISAHIATGGSPPAECSGTTLSAGEFVNITSSVLSPGNLSQGSGAGQEEIYYCIKQVGSITAQTYSTQQSGSWTIKVIALLVAISFRRKKKAKKNDTVIGEPSIPGTIFSRKIGVLETIVKYMKENLSLSYHEIALMLNRDDRTIWTAYSQALKKQKEPLEATKTPIHLPSLIFRNRTLTALEASVVYLKEHGMKYSEIASLVKRDQRNIWKICSRAMKKMKTKPYNI